MDLVLKISKPGLTDLESDLCLLGKKRLNMYHSFSFIHVSKKSQHDPRIFSKKDLYVTCDAHISGQTSLSLPNPNFLDASFEIQIIWLI